MPSIRIAAAQLNLVVGDLDGNTSRILGAYDDASRRKCDLVALPELAVTGYPPEDLLYRDAFIDQANEALAKIAAASGRCVGSHSLFHFADQIAWANSSSVAARASGGGADSKVVIAASQILHNRMTAIDRSCRGLPFRLPPGVDNGVRPQT